MRRLDPRSLRLVIPGFAIAAMLATSATATSPADPVATAPDASKPLRFVGEQEAMEAIECRRRPRRDADGELVGRNECHSDDLQYRAHYRVRDALDSGLGERVDFAASGWTSHYAHERWALVELVEIDGQLELPGGLAIAVYPTADGGWASCDDDRGSEPVEFAGDLVFGRTDGMSAYGIAQRFPPERYTVVGNEAFCIRGRRLPALLEELDREHAEWLRQLEFD